MKYGTVEWTIQNFSCWRLSFHNPVLKSLDFFGETHFEIKNLGEKSSVRMFWKSCSKVLGDLSILDRDGKELRSEEVDFYNEKDPFSEFDLQALDLRNIQGSINNSDYFLKDRITVRFRMKEDFGNVLSMKTVIPVHVFTSSITEESIRLFKPAPTKCIDTFKFRSPRGFLHSATVNGYSDCSVLYLEFVFMGKCDRTTMRLQACLINKEDIVIKMGVSTDMILEGNFKKRISTGIKQFEVVDGSHVLLVLRIISEATSELRCTYEQSNEGEGDSLPISSSILPASENCIKLSEKDTSVPLNATASNKSIEKRPKSESPIQSESSVTVLTEDLMCLYRDQVLSDFELVCDNVTFPVHRVILSARSPVFKNMFLTDMQEAASGRVDIVDIGSSTLALFMTFIYTGTVGKDLDVESALNLYYASDKYQVPSLMKECSNFLSANVSITNVCDILSLADKHEDALLLSVVHDFILRNYNQVLSSDIWNDFLKKYPLLAAKTLTHFGQRKAVGKLDSI